MWAVYEAQRTPEARTFAIVSVHHKASVEEDAAEGVTWWPRACNNAQEDIILLDTKATDIVLENTDAYRRPPKPKAPPLYCYIGIGIDKQPQCITNSVVRTNGPL